MQIEDYFDFHAANDIRLKDHRIGIESVLYEYMHRSQTPEDIVRRFPALRLDQVYATILYYLCNKEHIHNYMTEWIEHEDRMVESQRRNPPLSVIRLREIRAQRNSSADRQ